MLNMKIEKKKRFTLGEKNSFLELLILAELENEKEKEEILEKTAKFLKVMFKNKEELTEYYDYLVYAKDLSTASHGASMNLELYVSEIEYEGDLSSMTYEEYLSQVKFNVLDEFEGDNQETSFELSQNGLLEALQHFNRGVAARKGLLQK